MFSQVSVCPQGGSLSGGPLSRGCLCLGVSVQGGFFVWRSVSRGGVGSVSRGRGSVSWGGGSMSRGEGLCPGGLCLGGLCPGGVSVQLFHRDPCYSNTQVHPYNSCLTQVSSVIINICDEGN